VRRRVPAVAGPLLLAAGLLLLPACGGGGGGGGGGTDPPPPMSGLTFTAAGSATGPAMLLRRTGTGNQVLELEVAVQNASGLYGLFFDLTYPSSVLSFEGASEGGFLSSGGNPTAFQVSESQGRLVVGLTRLGQAGGRGGSGVLMTLRFRAVASGSGALAFSRNEAQQPNAELLDLEWIGGTVQADL
jgi:hypothetical protein